MTTPEPTALAVPIEVLRAARHSATRHHHPQPDDRMLAIVYAAARKQAAADIRDAPYPDPSPCLPAWHAGYTEAAETAARIAAQETP